ncbi:hypothetical protein D8674_010859 [Pyrus ussuriensis x Pyrus communis]|uniref:Multiple C2 domain-containing protein n=1 Tax=Pyrus ussuriensis x Pyrus communis TaxID=2448454 RepID=A0A5N5G1N3_9ROSA|nr:hypothetical protein D8674_010859 [Pyrus ussuriensis x Pyrus communis]
MPKSRWFNLVSDEMCPYARRIHLRVCVEGGYHVLDEVAHVISDVGAAVKQLAKSSIGLLEVGFHGATNLLSVKTKNNVCGTTDTYVVAKYRPKYKRDEEGKLEKDIRIGKIRVRLSTLYMNRVYMSSYSLTVLLPGGAKKMGEIEIAVRFSCSSWISLIQAYTSSMLPRVHYVRPLGPAQQDILRSSAMWIVTARLARCKPPLGQESRYRQLGPHNMDLRMSYVDAVSPEELDEELDGFPSTRPSDIIRIRYDRLQTLGGRAQTLLGDVAAQGERLEALFNWRDTRAAGIFVVFCVVASLVSYMVPFKAFVLGSGFYYLRHPRFRDDMPSVPANFFRQLPSLSDQIM